MTAVNHSNGDVVVSFDVTGNRLPGVGMRVNQTNSEAGLLAVDLPLEKVPAEGAQAPELSAYLWLSGKPDGDAPLDSSRYSRVAVIVISIEALGGDLTPTQGG